ncbi:hypothetical protein [Nannocystis pusilla]|uniref:hypothetical protein n=1 Tax=Nannocystis pusilla TaxID=889268 RepID=UPI003B7B8336
MEQAAAAGDAEQGGEQRGGDDHAGEVAQLAGEDARQQAGALQQVIVDGQDGEGPEPGRREQGASRAQLAA